MYLTLPRYLGKVYSYKVLLLYCSKNRLTDLNSLSPSLSLHPQRQRVATQLATKSCLGPRQHNQASVLVRRKRCQTLHYSSGSSSNNTKSDSNNLSVELFRSIV